MRRALLIIFLGSAGLVLLAAVAAGLFLAAFDPNAYTGRISAAVEKATNRQLQFQGDIVTSFFPRPTLKTGRLVMNDPGIFGGGAFITVESVSVSLAVKPLLRGIVQIEEISLRAPVVQLVTTAAGRNNWEYGFTDEQSVDGEAPRASAASGETGSAIPLTDPAQADSRGQGFFSRLVFQVERLTCRDGRVLFRDLRTGASYAGSLDKLTVDSLHPGADMPFAATGGLTDETTGRKLRFSLNGAARLAASGSFLARFDSFDLTASGLTAEPIAAKNRAEFLYDPSKRSLEMRELKGGFKNTGYEGHLALALPEGTYPARLTGGLSVTNLRVDELLSGQPPAKASSGGSEELKGAPNLTRPTVGPGGKSAAGNNPAGKAADRQAGVRDNKTTAVSLFDRINADVAVTVTGLAWGGFSAGKLAFSLRTEVGRISIPFILEALDGTATGTAWAEGRKNRIRSLTLSAVLRDMSMEKLCRALAAKTTVSGALSADLDVTGRGDSWKEIVSTLKGKGSFQVRKGEVRGFSLIPPNLRGIREVPTNFPFDRISGSGGIERGIFTSKDLSLRSALLSGAGGGTVNLAFERLDLGMDFMIAGQPPAIPVNITGPFNSLSSSVDIRTLMRNTAEGALRSPETARDLLKDAGRLLLR